MFAIYKKELRSYFITPVGYVYVGIFLALSALLCCYTTLHSTRACDAIREKKYLKALA